MKRLFGLFVLSAAVGCGIGPHVDDYVDAVAAGSVASCACEGYKILLFSSEEECRAEAPPDEAERGCVEALFKAQSADYEAHLDCRTAANQRYAACLNSKTCTDLARLECLAQLADEEEDCPDFPSDVQNDLNQCLD